MRAGNTEQEETELHLREFIAHRQRKGVERPTAVSWREAKLGARPDLMHAHQSTGSSLHAVACRFWLPRGLLYFCTACTTLRHTAEVGLHFTRKHGTHRNIERWNSPRSRQNSRGGQSAHKVTPPEASRSINNVAVQSGVDSRSAPTLLFIRLYIMYIPMMKIIITIIITLLLLYVVMSVHMYVCVYNYNYTYIYMYICISLSLYIYMYTHIYSPCSAVGLGVRL